MSRWIETATLVVLILMAGCRSEGVYQDVRRERAIRDLRGEKPLLLDKASYERLIESSVSHLSDSDVQDLLRASIEHSQVAGLDELANESRNKALALIVVDRPSLEQVRALVSELSDFSTDADEKGRTRLASFLIGCAMAVASRDPELTRPRVGKALYHLAEGSPGTRESRAKQLALLVERIQRTTLE